MIRTLEQAFSYIESFTNLEKGTPHFNAESYRLDRMLRLLELYGDPQRDFRVVHLAGTKGKGSTSAFAASILQEAGFRTGLYTSPHVSSYLERILVDGKPLSEETVVGLVDSIRLRLEELPDLSPTTFELLSLLGFLCFREARCRYAVVETGIGGRLDATNTVSPFLCLITPIELEHTEVLGDTLKRIAFEKGGIIKKGIPVFVGLQKPEVREVISRIARRRGAPCVFLEDEIARIESRCTAQGTEALFYLADGAAHRFQLTLLGDFQAENAALAWLALRTGLPQLPAPAFERGLHRAFLPGRMELARKRPPVILDGAHTPMSVGRLLSSFRTIFGDRGVLLFSSVAGKRFEEMAATLAPAFDDILITTPGNYRESHPEQILAAFSRHGAQARLIADPGEALDQALKLAGDSRPLLITGSFYLVGEIKNRLRNLEEQA